jgi:hypothetical protein
VVRTIINIINIIIFIFLHIINVRNLPNNASRISRNRDGQRGFNRGIHRNTHHINDNQREFLNVAPWYICDSFRIWRDFTPTLRKIRHK